MKRFVCMMTVLLLLCSLAVPCFAQGEGSYIFDEADLLTAEEEASLSGRAAVCESLYGVGVYIITVDTYPGGDFFTYAETLYRQYGLGVGSEEAGILLLLSMEGRDYALAAYGNSAHYAFTDYGKEIMSDAFCEEFGEDDWFGGFESYMKSCEADLKAASEGKPVDVDLDMDVYGKYSTLQVLLFLFFVPIGVALAVCVIMKSKMKSAVLGKNANIYIPQNGVRLRQKLDQYTHTTEQRIQMSSSDGKSGGTSVHSSGFSGHSGKF